MSRELALVAALAASTWMMGVLNVNAVRTMRGVRFGSPRWLCGVTRLPRSTGCGAQVVAAARAAPRRQAWLRPGSEVVCSSRDLTRSSSTLCSRPKVAKAPHTSVPSTCSALSWDLQLPQPWVRMAGGLQCGAGWAECHKTPAMPPRRQRLPVRRTMTETSPAPGSGGVQGLYGISAGYSRSLPGRRCRRGVAPAASRASGGHGVGMGLPAHVLGGDGRACCSGAPAARGGTTSSYGSR